jgi:hypothetical protein
MATTHHYASTVSSNNDSTVKSPSHGSESLQAQYRGKLKGLRDELEKMAGTANYLIHVIDEISEKGGNLSVQDKINFLTGSLARIQKDYGVIEHLQYVFNFVLKRKRPTR